MENNNIPEQEENVLISSQADEISEQKPSDMAELEPVAQEISLEEAGIQEDSTELLSSEEEAPAADTIPAPEDHPSGLYQEPITQEEPVDENAVFLPVSDETMVDHDTLQQIQEAVAQELSTRDGSDSAPVLQPLAESQDTVVLSEMPVLDTEPTENETAEELPPEPAVDQDYRDNSDEFHEIFHKPAEEAAIPTHDRPTRKGRPKRKRGELLFGLPTIAVTVIWLAIILTVGTTLGRMLWACASDVLAFGRADKTVTINIYQSDTIEEITDKLQKGGLIRYPGLFKLYASLAVDEGEIKPGVWDLNTLYDYHALVAMMSRDKIYEEVEVMIPEGYTCAQIFALLEENKVCTAKDLAAWAANGELDEYWFLCGTWRRELFGGFPIPGYL